MVMFTKTLLYYPRYMLRKNINYGCCPAFRSSVPRAHGDRPVSKNLFSGIRVKNWYIARKLNFNFSKTYTLITKQSRRGKYMMSYGYEKLRVFSRRSINCRCFAWSSLMQKGVFDTSLNFKRSTVENSSWFRFINSKWNPQNITS